MSGPHLKTFTQAVDPNARLGYLSLFRFSKKADMIAVSTWAIHRALLQSG
jgi:hypothetical protein